MNKLSTSLDLMMTDLNISDQQELFSLICRKAEEKGFVLPSFYGDLLIREQEFPTGLETVIPIAIPHVGTSCVQSFFSLATLKEPILFKNMADVNQELPVRIVFLFGIVDPGQQVNILRKLSEIFQKQETLKSIAEAKEDVDLMAIIKNELTDYFA